MHGPGLIVAEREETDKKVLLTWTVFSCLTLAPLRERPLVGHGRGSVSCWERERTLRTALLALVLPCSQVLHELNCDETETGQQKRVDESTLVHHELQDKPDDEQN